MERPLACLLGDPDDLCAAYAGWILRRAGAEVLELREAELGERWSFAFDDLRPREGALTFEGRALPLGDLRAVFVRMHPRPGLPTSMQDLQPADHALVVHERRAALQHLLVSLDCAVANPPSAGRSNGSKPFQMGALARRGFDVPRWIASNDAARVAEFVEGCPDGAIVKSCSGLRSRVRRADADLLVRLRAGSPAVVVQEYVAGGEVRVHAVVGEGGEGGEVFATEVVASTVDYRFDGAATAHRAVEPPQDVARLCLEATRDEGLLIGGLDFRVDRAGGWRCLELNPAPTFLTYEAATGQPIGAALARRMLAGSPAAAAP